MQFRTLTLGSRCTLLALAITALWLLVVLPAQRYFGMAGVEASGVSAVSCLLGGWVTFWLTTRLTQPRMQAVAVLFGTGIRGVFALAGAIVMDGLLGLAPANYLIWLGLFYLVSLALETVLLMKPTGEAGTR
jgi:hypothetical protein